MERQWLRFGRFNAVGLLGAALQLMVFYSLMRALDLPAAAAAFVAVEAAVLHNFFWHERFTWRDRQTAGLRQRAVRLGRFHAANALVSLAGNTAVAALLVDWLHAPAIPSALAAIALCAPVNFLLADRWVYSGRG
ncbi:MAG TPA: GtrA family protein [Bryobacteraceae bacterium]|nr:GtrA family protein [Bryobacteraceae bacterium]